MRSPVRIVVFDLGGVVVRICRSWQEGCAAAGIEYRERPADEQAVRWRKDLNTLYQEGRIRCDEFFQGIAATADGLYTPEEIRRVHDAWLLGEYPGVVSLVDRVHRAGLSTGVLSNTNHSHWGLLPAYPAISRMKNVHASHLLGLTKPNEAIYRAFERATGRDPADVLFFDDLAENIEGARRAGWRAEQIDHTGDTAAQMLEHLGRHGAGV